MNWIPTIDPPAKPGIESYEQVPCLVVRRGEISILLWNCEHLCWDGEDGDDYCCDFKDVDYYIPLSELPPIPKK